MTKTLSNCIHLFYKQSVRGPLIRNTQSANRIAQEVGERRAACSNVYKIGFSCKPKGLRKSNSERKEATMQRYTRPQNISFTLWGMGTAFCLHFGCVDFPHPPRLCIYSDYCSCCRLNKKIQMCSWLRFKRQTQSL